jgi:hypothetical protein
MQQIDKDIAFSDFYERKAGSMQGYMSTCIPTLKNTESSPSSQFNFDVQTDTIYLTLICLHGRAPPGCG